MTRDPRSQPHSTAIAQLEAFRLSTYAARTFVALTSLGSGTAKEVSEVSDVPRTRVYDAVDELHDRGLVDIRQSTPQEFMPISAEAARETLEREVQQRLTLLITALGQLRPTERTIEQQGIWTVGTETAILDRIVTFFNGSTDEIVYLADEQFFSTAVIDGLAAAADRGVSVTLGGCSTEMIERFRGEIPTAERIDPVTWSTTVTSRLVLVDGSTMLLSVRDGRLEPDGGDPNAETAIWATGETNGLVVVCKSLFGLDS